MPLGAYVCGWFVEADADLGRLVTNGVQKKIAIDGLAVASVQSYWPDARPDNGEPSQGAVLVVVDAPDATHRELEKLANREIVPIDPKSQQLNSIQTFLQDRGVVVDLSSAATRKDAAGRVVRTLKAGFVDFTGPASGL